MSKNPVRYQIVRGPTRKPVSGMYRDKTEAIAKADDLDDHRGTAKERVAAARETIAILDLYRNPPLPDTCDDCGGPLGGKWVETDDGTALCRNCANIDPDV